MRVKLFPNFTRQHLITHKKLIKKTFFYQTFCIDGLHVMSRRPCWWTRTKAFLSSGN